MRGESFGEDGVRGLKRKGKGEVGGFRLWWGERVGFREEKSGVAVEEESESKSMAQVLGETERVREGLQG